MDRTKGIAFCGLACALCSEGNDCPGCRNDGCTNKQWCKNLQCCKSKGLEGCWECSDFPCEGTILDKLRIRTFSTFAKHHGVQLLLECLERNEQAGIQYHYPGKLTGDYDIPESEEAIFDMLLQAKRDD